MDWNQQYAQLIGEIEAQDIKNQVAKQKLIQEIIKLRDDISALQNKVKQINVMRDQLRALCDFLQGKAPCSPSSSSSAVRLKSLLIKPDLPDGFYWEEDHIVCAKDEATMVYIPAGEFLIAGRKIYLDAYLIDVYPVTNAQFKEFIDCKGYERQEYWSQKGWEFRKKKNWMQPRYWGHSFFNFSNCPVVGVSWFETEAYCNWAGKRLPTEAQWIKAARGGIWLDGDKRQKIGNPLPEREYPWGNEVFDANGIWRANYCDTPEYGNKCTSPVGYFSEGASPYGCLDLAGNVWEWCLSWHQDDYLKKGPKKNPVGPARGLARVLLGGSWKFKAWSLDCVTPYGQFPEYRRCSYGFRTVF